MDSAYRRRREWDDLGRVDPFWGVVTVPDFKHGDRAAAPPSFWESGEVTVEETVAAAERLGLTIGRELALDFGSGVGRLSRALASRFARVVGVDVSPVLIERARVLNEHLANCDFRLLEPDTLDEFGGRVDLVYSIVVLQHQQDAAAVKTYIRSFIRMLNPKGVAVFQLPTHLPLLNRVQPRRRVYGALRRLGVPADVLYGRLGLDPIRMLALSSASVTATVEEAGGTVIAARPDHLAGTYPSATYYVVPTARDKLDP